MWQQSTNVTTLFDANGALVLDLRTGGCHSLNPVAARIWTFLGRPGLGGDEIEEALRREISDLPDHFRRDLHSFIDEMTAKGLVERGSVESGGGLAHWRRSSLDRTLPATIFGLARLLGPFLRVEWGATGARLALIVVDLTLKFGGYPALRRLVMESAVAQLEAKGAALDWKPRCDQLERAAAFYYKHPWCLQRSAALAYFLKASGAHATLVVGCRRIPFAAHAWVEIDGQVVNDDARVRRHFTDLDRM